MESQSTTPLINVLFQHYSLLTSHTALNLFYSQYLLMLQYGLISLFFFFNSFFSLFQVYQINQTSTENLQSKRSHSVTPQTLRRQMNQTQVVRWATQVRTHSLIWNPPLLLNSQVWKLHHLSEVQNIHRKNTNTQKIQIQKKPAGIRQS